MVKVIIRVNVAYPGRFLETFGLQAEQRRANGEQASFIGQSADIPNVLVIVLDWDAADGAKRFWRSPATERLIKEWHSIPTQMQIDVVEGL